MIVFISIPLVLRWPAPTRVVADRAWSAASLPPAPLGRSRSARAVVAVTVQRSRNPHLGHRKASAVPRRETAHGDGGSVRLRSRDRGIYSKLPIQDAPD